MDLTFQKLQYKRLVNAVFTTQEETAEINISDALPDAVRIADCRATIFVRDRIPCEGGADIRAVVRMTALYIPEKSSQDATVGTEHPIALETPITFHHHCDLPGATADCELFCTAEIINADARLINSRKLHVRAEVSFSTRVFRETEEALADGVSGEHTEVLCKNAEMVLPMVSGSKNFTVIEEIPLNGVNPEEILAATAVLRTVGCTLNADRAELSGKAQMELLYCDADGLTRSHTAEMSFTQSADFPGIDENMISDVRFSLRSLEYEAVQDVGAEQTLTLTFAVTAEAVFYEVLSVSLLTDAYNCLSYANDDSDLTLQTEPYTFHTPCKSDIFADFHETVDTSADVTRLISYGLTAPESVEINGEGTNVRVMLHALWQAADGTLNTITRRIPVTLPASDCIGIQHPEISDADVHPVENGLDVRFKITAVCIGGMQSQIDVVTAVESGNALECRKDISLTLRFAHNSTLWELGREYHAPIAMIRALNHLPTPSDSGVSDELTPLPDGVILIPHVRMQ